MRRSAGAVGTEPGSRAAAGAREGGSGGRGGLRETGVALRVEPTGGGERVQRAISEVGV